MLLASKSGKLIINNLMGNRLEPINNSLLGNLSRRILCQSVFIRATDPFLLGYGFSWISLISAKLHHSNTRASRRVQVADPIDNIFVAILDGKPIAVKRNLCFSRIKNILHFHVKCVKDFQTGKTKVWTSSFPVIYHSYTIHTQ